MTVYSNDYPEVHRFYYVMVSRSFKYSISKIAIVNSIGGVELPGEFVKGAGGSAPLLRVQGQRPRNKDKFFITLLMV